MDRIYSILSNSNIGISKNTRTNGCSVTTRAVFAGAIVGLVGGAVSGGYLGATAGTFTVPILGTAVGGVGGAVFGAAAGFVGGATSTLFSELLLSCFRYNSSPCDNNGSTPSASCFQSPIDLRTIGIY